MQKIYDGLCLVSTRKKNQFNIVQLFISIVYTKNTKYMSIFNEIFQALFYKKISKIVVSILEMKIDFKVDIAQFF